MYLPKVNCACGDVVVKSSLDGVTKIRAKIMVLKEDSAYAVCKSCGSEVKIPVKIQADAAFPPLFIKNK